MKLLIFDTNKKVISIPESSIARSGQPWFMPDFGVNWRWRKALAVKVSRLGKGVSYKHANRYVDSMTVLWVAEADPCNALQFMDGRVVCGQWLPIHDELSEEIKDAIVEVSKYSTLKNGDIIAVMLSDEPIGIEQNTTISIDLNDENVAKFNIK